jgi:bla regulator protein BlaR1
MINHLWQSTVFAMAAGLLTLALRGNRASVRYWLWFSASLKFLIPFAFLISLGSRVGQPVSPAVVAMSPLDPAMIVKISEPFPYAAPPQTTWIPFIVFGLWMSGFVAIALLRQHGWQRVRAAIRASSRIEIGAPVEVRSAPGLLEPGVVGWIRPILLLPAGIVERLTPHQLEAVLAHELCHVRRRDNLTAAVHMMVEAIFWFHPLVWWIGARLVDERERACDEEVLLMGSEPQTYAEGILKVCERYLESPLPFVSGVTGANLRKRIEEIMSNRIGIRLSFGKKIALAAVGAATLTAPMVVGILNPPVVRGQSPAAPLLKFEVASVKPHKPEAGPLRASTSVENGRINYTNVTLKNCIRQAYGLRPYQISGGPGWLADDRYDVIAKAAGSATKAQVMLMLQALLADRFKLTFHFEAKEMPVYSLVIAKNGPKIKEVKDDGNGTQIDGDPQHALNARNISMAQFAGTLSRLQDLDRPVMDRTGLRGVFNITVDFVADDAASPDTVGPSIFTALSEQLGLKLEPTKGPVQILVIDHIERPSEN